MLGSEQLVLNALKIIDEISVDALSLLLTKQKLNLLDIREPKEVAEGVVPGSFWVPRGVLEFEISSVLEKLGWSISDPVYINCRSGNRSALAAVSLLEMGFKNPVSVAGGFNAWTEAGYPSTKDFKRYS